MTTSLRICAFLALFVAAPTLEAQDFGRIADTQAQSPGYFFYARTGEPVIGVTAVGAVGASGRYLVGEGANLADLIALTGRVETASPSGEDPIVRLYRDGGTAFESGLRSIFGPGAVPPVLEDGDVIEVNALVSSAPGFFVHSRPGAATVQVTAAGAFGAPGRYVLDEGATAGDLVALARGVAVGVRDVNLDVTSTVRVYRNGGVQFESPLEDLYLRPSTVLQSGDVVDLEVLTEERTRFTLRDGLSIFGTLLTAGLLIERILE